MESSEQQSVSLKSAINLDKLRSKRLEGDLYKDYPWKFLNSLDLNEDTQKYYDNPQINLNHKELINFSKGDQIIFVYQSNESTCITSNQLHHASNCLNNTVVTPASPPPLTPSSSSQHHHITPENINNNNLTSDPPVTPSSSSSSVSTSACTSALGKAHPRFYTPTHPSSSIHCVMCGLSNVDIPSQNKSVCKHCDSCFWLHQPWNVVFKFCKGCKNFYLLNAFENRPEGTKCMKCRHRGREHYKQKKTTNLISSNLSTNNTLNNNNNVDNDSTNNSILSSISLPNLHHISPLDEQLYSRKRTYSNEFTSLPISLHETIPLSSTKPPKIPKKTLPNIPNLNNINNNITNNTCNTNNNSKATVFTFDPLNLVTPSTPINPLSINELTATILPPLNIPLYSTTSIASPAFNQLLSSPFLSSGPVSPLFYRSNSQVINDSNVKSEDNQDQQIQSQQPQQSEKSQSPEQPQDQWQWDPKFNPLMKLANVLYSQQP